MKKIDCTGYAVYPSKVVIGTMGSYGSEQLQITFDDAWDGLTKRVSFWDATGAAVGAIYLEGEIVTIPDGVYTHSGLAKMVIDGADANKTFVSLTISLEVLTTMVPEDVTPKPADEYYEQLMDAFQSGKKGDQGEPREKGDKGDKGEPGWAVLDITGQALNINSFNRNNGYTEGRWKCVTGGGAAAITGLPTNNLAFYLELITIRDVSNTDALQVQTLITGYASTTTYIRRTNNNVPGTWTAWRIIANDGIPVIS